MLCLRLQIYSFVFYGSLAICVSPCLYLTILSGTQGIRAGDGDGLMVRDGRLHHHLDILFSRAGFLTTIVWFTLPQSSSAQFCNIF